MAVRVIDAAAFAKVSIVVYPELYLHGYHHPRLNSRGEDEFSKDQEMLRMVGEAAGRAGVAVAMGYLERPAGNGDAFNSGRVWHADGTVAYNYRKVRLSGDREKSLFAQEIQDQHRAFKLRLGGREVPAGVCASASLATAKIYK